MKKKRYIQPQIEGYTVQSTELLAGSLDANSGDNTGEQKAKQGDFDFNFEEENY